MIELILAFCLSRVQHITGRFNERARWNGYGAIQSTLDKSADAPMNYRVLVPWLMRGGSIERYEFIRFALLWVMLLSVRMVWGLPVMLVFCVLLAATMFYNYWDYAPELIGITLAMSGNINLAVIGIVLHALSRETVWLDVPLYLSVTGDWLGAALLLFISAFAWLSVRKIQGFKPLYCKRWMHFDNAKMLLKPEPPYLLYAPYVSITLCGLALAGAVARGGLSSLIVPIMVLAGLTMAKVNETRIFTAVLPFAAWWLL